MLHLTTKTRLFSTLKGLGFARATPTMSITTPTLDGPAFQSVSHSNSQAFRLPQRETNFGHSAIQKREMATNGEAWHPVLTESSLNPCIRAMEYAVRGPLVIRASAIEKELQQGADKPFKEVIKANIGDAHAMGQKPITYLRQVVALVTYPSLLDGDHGFPEDAKEHARTILSAVKGSAGCYSESVGVEIIRKHVADYITRRDNATAHPARLEDVFLCAGASEGIRAVLKLLSTGAKGADRTGVLTPIPQYPLYSASIVEYDMELVGYYLDESRNWALDMTELRRSLSDSRNKCKPKAIVVINPGNPTGQVLSRENIEDIIKFAYEENLFVMADEVYQDNVYAPGSAFHSFRSVLFSLGEPYVSRVELASFLSTSKGYMGECGLRGGYCELLNVDPAVRAQLQKSISAKLCPTVLGQTAMDVVVNPPKEGQPSYDLFQKEKKAVLDSLAKRALMVAEQLNAIPGIHCNVVQGAMYAFPSVELPAKAIEKAKEKGLAPDAYWAFQLLEQTGICIVPGSGFGQRPNTYHFRTTILPQVDKIEVMLSKIADFQKKFLAEHQ